MLGGGRDSCLLHSPDERRAVGRHRRRAVPELTLEHADGLVPVGGSGRYDIHHRGQVEIEACRPEFTAPDRGLPLQDGRGQAALGQSRRYRGKARALQGLDLSALLVRGDEEAGPAGSPRGSQRLICASQLVELGYARREVARGQQRAEVVRRDRLGDVRDRVSRDADQEQLADPLGFGHAGENLSRAGGQRRLRR